MKIRFWGVRGSIPCPGPKTMKYGGNTMCIEMRMGDPEKLLIVDAGSGIRELGNYLMANDFPKGPIKADIMLTHTHWDHIMGFPFFTPVFIPGTNLRVYGPVNFKTDSLEKIVGGQLEYDYFPIRQVELSADIEYIELQVGKKVDLGYDDIRLTTKLLNHPILCLGYRFEYKGKVVCTAYDTEPYQNLFYLTSDDPSYDESKVQEGKEYADELNQQLIDFFSGADLLIHDGQYTTKEYYDSKIGWGHTPMEYAINAAQKAGVKNLALVHHDPLSSDEMLNVLSDKYCNSPDLSGINIFFAREGMEIDL